MTSVPIRTASAQVRYPLSCGLYKAHMEVLFFFHEADNRCNVLPLLGKQWACHLQQGKTQCNCVWCKQTVVVFQLGTCTSWGQGNL